MSSYFIIFNSNFPLISGEITLSKVCLNLVCQGHSASSPSSPDLCVVCAGRSLVCYDCCYLFSVWFHRPVDDIVFCIPSYIPDVIMSAPTINIRKVWKVQKE